MHDSHPHSLTETATNRSAAAHRKQTSAPQLTHGDRHPRDRLRRELGLLDATLLCVSSIIGVGIFLTPGSVAELVPHPGLFLAAWLIGGALSLMGALANAELGAMFPHAGGDYVYLREAYHPVAGFVVGWLSFFVIYAGTVATLAAGFAEGLGRFLPLDTAGMVALAVLLIALTSAVNYWGVRRGAQVNNVTATVKIGAMVALAAVAFSTGRGAWEHLHPVWPRADDVRAPALGLALSPVLFSYLGWNAPVYIASEIHRPERNIPRALFLGLAVCTALYVLLNVVYLYALPIHELAGTVRVGEATAEKLFGAGGATAIAMLVLASVLGCLNATILVGPRIAYAMALDDAFFAGVDRVHHRFGTPHRAIVAQAVTAIVLVLILQRFPRVLDYTTFAIVLATAADTSALYALRWRRPEQPRPYRAWGYPWLPALYLLANAGIATAMLLGRPLECMLALAVTATAVPFYFWFQPRGVETQGAPTGT